MTKNQLTICFLSSLLWPLGACSTIDTSITCGNSQRDEGEQCDDGNKYANDGCDSLCQIEKGYSCYQLATGQDNCTPICGDGFVTGAEECDDGNTENCDFCDSNCQIYLPKCGDGIVCGDEECDDGNENNCDGCLDTCKKHENICGDGVVCGDEFCDDGNFEACDGCHNCQQYVSVCGDGIICAGEACDDGNNNNCDSCSNDCRRNYNICGDGVTCGQEQCDNGTQNKDPCSGCMEDCTIHINYCGDGYVCGLEDCDDPEGLLNGFCNPDYCSVDGSTDGDHQNNPFLSNHRVRLVWSDEFNGPVAGEEECYEQQPYCMSLYWQADLCDSAYEMTAAQQSFRNGEEWLVDLAGLNKCTWAVMGLYNWMDYDKPLGSGVNAFHPAMVKVKDGTLQLSSKAMAPKNGFGQLTAKSAIKDIYSAYDCGNTISGQYGNTKECPIISGGLWSRKFAGKNQGFNTTYGHWEVKAKLPIGAGSWPAHWLLPDEGNWPVTGEIDIMEATYKKGETAAVAANFHGGRLLVDEDNNQKKTHYSANSLTHSLAMSWGQQHQQFHIYSVDWTPTYLEYFVDNASILKLKAGQKLKEKDNETGTELGTTPMDIPDIPFHWILNSTVAAFDKDNYPNPLDFDESTQIHTIDYIRNWQDCSTDEAELCPAGGTYANGYCALAVSSSRTIFHMDDQLFYQTTNGSCTSGGTLSGDRCIIYQGTPDRRPLVRDGRPYYASPCKESTLSPYCDTPCEGQGTFKKNRCVIFEAPEGAAAFVNNNNITCSQLNQSGVKKCPLGTVSGAFCQIGAVPAGLTVKTEERQVYFEPACQPAAAMPNCAEPCPNGGYFDGTGCLIGQAPTGATALLKNDNFYYTYPATTTTLSCPLGTLEADNNRCLVEPVPAGASGLVAGDKFYLKASCAAVPVASFHHLDE